LGVKHQHFDKFKKHLETILIDMEKPAELIKEIMAKVEEQRHFIVFEERSGDPKIVD
jgi:ABC-type Zn uptake system ZnuABC Zn-binding protein ZnuA